MDLRYTAGMFAQVIDANINRVAEGLRVIEEYARFVAGHREMSERLSRLRHDIATHNPGWPDQLMSRDTHTDARAGEIPQRRESIVALLQANCRRVTEGLRVLEEYTGDPRYNRCRYTMYELEKELLLGLLKPTIRRGIYVISSDVDVLIDAANRGAVMIQLRDKANSKADLFDQATRLMALRDPSVPVIINDYVDIALAVGADGVHGGQDEMPISQQRRLMGPHRLIGRTTHSLEQGIAAQADGADYVSVGPIWETPSKPGREGIGLAYLGEAAQHLSIPYVAIGGIDLGRAALVAPFRPPLVGVVRAVDQLEAIQALLENS
ncbi:thiamine phosphate synthase [bacterium]|nr:thiamine phosphate synthase [bacterium]